MKTAGLKRGIALLLSIVMVLGMCGVSVPVVKAEEKMQDSGITFTITADKKEVKPGDIVTLSVNMKGNRDDSGIYAVVFKANYDPDVIEPVKTEDGEWDFTPGNAPSGSMIVMSGGTSERVSVSFTDFTQKTTFQDGTLLTGKFKVKDDAPAGAFAFQFLDGPEDIQVGHKDEGMMSFSIDDQTKGMQVVRPVTGITLDKTSMTLDKGTTGKLTATLVPEGSSGQIQWTSSNENVASVDQDGTVHAKATGTAEIKAAVNGVSASCSVKVTNTLKGITITAPEDRHTLKKGQTLQLRVVPDPADAEGDLTAKWTSSDSRIADVNDDGLVTAKADGKATIQATVSGLTAAYEIEVKEVKLTGISLNKTKTTIHRGESEQLTATPIPADTTDDTRVKWESSDPQSVTVDGNGMVTAVGLGGATITATMGGFSQECVVTVDAPLKAIKPDQTEMTLLKGQTAKLGYTLDPVDTTDNRAVRMTSSDSDVVEVDSATGMLTAKKEGTITVTLTGANNISATVIVRVEEIPVEGVVLDRASAEVEKGDSITLTATIVPENTTDEDKSITWTSSDESIVTVSPNKTASGEPVEVKATDKGGTAVITAKTANGKTAECQIRVPIHMEAIEIEDVDVLRGKTVSMTDHVRFTPENTDDDRTLTWTSSDPSVVAVDARTGVATALREGEATLTATTTGTKEPISASAKMTVKENHLTAQLAEHIKFAGITEAVLKGQSIYLTEWLNLETLVEEEQITDDIALTWSISDDAVASVDQNGCLTGLSEGKVTVTLQIISTDGSQNLTGTYTVETEVEVEEIPLDSIAFDKIIRQMTVGETVQLGILYHPTNTTDSREITWSVSDASVLEVVDGQITALKSGKAVVTAKADGVAPIQMEITVRDTQSNGTGSDSQDKADGADKGGAVQTGDTVHPLPYIAGILLAGFAVVFAIILRRRKRS